MTRCSFIGILLLILPSPAPAAGVVRIPADVTVEGGQIELGAIAQVDGLTEAQKQQLTGIRLGPAAPPAQMRVFAGEALRRQAARLDGAPVLDIADEVRVHTAYREVDPEYLRARLADAIHHRMSWPREAVTLSSWRLPERFAVPVRAQRLVVVFRQGEDFLGRVTVRMRLLDPEDHSLPSVERAGSVVIGVRLPVAVIEKRVRRGQILDAGSLRSEERDLSTLPARVIRDPLVASGRRAARTLSEGSVLLENDLERDALVRRGDSVVVDGGGGGLELRIEARALEQGALGERIRVENPATRHRFMVAVTGEGTAELPWPSVGSGR